MTCDDYKLKISALLDGEIAAADSAEIFRHMGTCIDCRQFWQDVFGLNAQLDVVGLRGISTTELSLMANKTAAHSGLWNRSARLRPYLLSIIVCALVGLSFLVGRSRMFSAPETIYITKLPVVVATSETQITHIKTEGELQ
jgi:predicted anti-sigma-YlaC factor YlaD